MITIHNLIADKRKKLNKTLREVTNETGISIQFLSDIEHERRNPGDWQVEKLAKALKLDSDYMFFLLGKLPLDIKGNSLSQKQVERIMKQIRLTRDNNMIKNQGKDKEV